MESLTAGETADFGVEDDQSAEYGVRHCQEMSVILQRLINDGINISETVHWPRHTVPLLGLCFSCQFSDLIAACVWRKAGIPRRLHRHRHPREDRRWHARHARFPEVISLASWTTRRRSRDDPREDVGDDVGVGVGVVECELNGRAFARDPKSRAFECRPVRFPVTTMGKLLTCMCILHQAVGL